MQVKLLLEMLVKKCGLEAVKGVMPEEHMKLLTNIRKVCHIQSKMILTLAKKELIVQLIAD